ncbi:putative phosphomannomutase [Selenomonas ruminantium subsp. lactilytica TAM6421]|uniref:Putative phosphomannomutase n=1 Tax=Selenomonas ruminantium subsp. lactilytica (strain NBRC 103574 / TAM6421) TaxID=927704 RepID=I0GRP4_SELRL|nr:phosphomannomutase/phosphoglucomutase [Selenomonas ruminantium]BAL83431.1 putative phosphomannomutase [Selenomonas ruminantium subsp. lactilytica TAM6421]
MSYCTEAFGAYDIRGIYPKTINEDIAYRIGRFFPGLFGTRMVVVGHDIRLSGPALKKALVRGLTESGCDVVDIGQCGTEMIYFATDHLKLDGGVMITASHNPKEYNGMKFVRQEARPISGDTGLRDLEKQVADGELPAMAENAGKVETVDIAEEYVKHILSYVDVSELKPLKVVVNAGNGAAGPILDVMEKYLPFELVKVHHQPDGNFPDGVPNPLLPENREATVKAVRESSADAGVAWDGDFDRCFMFDEQGNFIEGYYMVGFLAQAFLQKNPGEKIIYDPRLTWNTEELVRENGGVPVMSKSGHAFIKEKMRAENAIYGGEMSAHHYFRDFSYCDSGMIPWLLVLELLSKTGKKLSDLMKERMDCYPCSGEINSKVKDADNVLHRIEMEYGSQGKVTKVDGLSVEFDNWRFNLRKSNTEPVIRLNVETRHNKIIMCKKTEELLAKIMK